LVKSAIILAGGFSTRFGTEKGLLQLAHKPLVKHVLDAVGDSVDEKLVVVSSKKQAEKYIEVIDSDVSVAIDKADLHTPLVGASTGFSYASGEYSLLLPCDTPLVRRDILSLLLELCVNKNAAVPRWPNCYTEPLQAVYRTKPALEAAKNALCKGEFNLRAMMDKLTCIRFISTLALRQLDPDLETFFNVNTPSDLKRAEQMLKHPKSYSFFSS